MVLYKDTPLMIRSKIVCYSLKRKRHFKRFELLNGDIPIVVLTKNGAVEVVNTRGLAYAARNRMCYRKTKKQRLNNTKKVDWLNS